MDMTHRDWLSRRLGLGCGRLNGAGDKARSLRLVHTALDLGIRYFDTAPPYGLGASESVLGEALKGRQENVLIATKAGLPRPAAPGFKQKARAVVKPLARWVPGLRQAVLKGMALSAPASNFERDFIARSFETSLRQLGRERVDRLLLHEARPQDELAPLEPLLQRCVDSGQLGGYGSATGEDVGQLVPFGTLRQYRCPEPGAPGTPVGDEDVLHGALRFLAPAIAAALAREPRLQDPLAALLPPGTEPAKATGALALAYALTRFDGRLLVSTQDPRRLQATLEQLRHVLGSPALPAAMAGLHSALEEGATP